MSSGDRLPIAQQPIIGASPRCAAGVLLAAIALAGLWQWRHTAVKAEDRVCLLTGFEPFGENKTNASWEMLQPLSGRTIAGYRIATARLPVVYDELARPLLEAIEQHKPQLVIGFGLGGPVVEVELLARNGYNQKQLPDNTGRPPPRAEILPGGPAEIPTQLPAAAILRALQEARIGARESRDAGGYLCNECFYRLMALPAWHGLPGREHGQDARATRGFVHVPAIGAPDPAGGTFTLEKLQEAVRIIVEQTARANGK